MITGDPYALLQAGIELISGEENHGLPEEVARYIRGESSDLPAHMGEAFEGRETLLAELRAVFQTEEAHQMRQQAGGAQ